MFSLRSATSLASGSSCHVKPVHAWTCTPLPFDVRVNKNVSSSNWFSKLPSSIRPDTPRCISTSYKLSRDQEDTGSATQPTLHARNLVLTVDTSPDSQYAVEWTVANIFRFGDTIHLLHCVPKAPKDVLFANPSGNLLYVPTGAEENPNESEMEEARKRIADLYCKRMEEKSIPYKLTIVGEEGAAFAAGIGDRVTTVAEELQASMIVVASHRKSAFAEFMMGSISNFLVHHSALPVLVITAPRKDEESHLRATGTRHIVIAVDASDTAVYTTKWALENIVRHGDAVHLLHVIAAAPVRPIIHSFGDGIIVSGPYGAAGGYDEQADRQEWLREDLKRRFSDLFVDVDCELSIDLLTEDVEKPLESVASAICKRCDELGAAALVTTSGGKGLMAEFFMGSVTSYCAHNCKSPVIVLH